MKQNIENIIAEFLPIILIYIYIKNNKEFLAFSNSILGKIISIIIIIFYTILNKYIGLLICFIIIIFYKYNKKESFDILEYTNTENLSIDEIENVEDPIYLDINTNAKNKELKKNTIDKEKTIDKKIIRENKEDFFRKTNCNNGNLYYKNMKIKNEMVEHIFPEMKYKNIICNPCNETCEISIIDTY
jgi:hypothetical protein